MDLLNYSEVYEDVIRETNGGEIDQWELETEEVENDLIWIYRFIVFREGIKFYIVINAATGEFLVFEVND